METILIAVTSLSLAAAAGMGAMLVRTLRLERRRSDARVALLEELAGNPPVRTPERPLRPAVTYDDFELHPSSTRAGAIFEEHHDPSPWPRRFAVIGVVAIVLSVAFLAFRTIGAPDRGSTNQQAAAGSAGQPELTAVTLPLELLSLQHAAENGWLVISGMVQNPRGSAALSGVQATVVLLTADGQPLATDRAPLDFTTLAPGAESPFVIRVAAASEVARYRVGFRSQDGRVLGHVDRRNTDAIARKQAP